MSEMFGQVVASRSVDKALSQGNDKGEPAPPDAFGSASPAKAAAELPGTPCDAGNRRLLPALMSTSAVRRPTASARLPVGIILYLASIALFAVATIGVFFGVGFFLLVQPTEAMIEGVADTHRSDLRPPFFVVFSRLFGNSSSPENKAARAPTELETPGSAAIAALPPAPLAQSSIPDQDVLPQKSQTVTPSLVADRPTGVTPNSPSEHEVQGSEPAEASAAAPAPTAGSSEPAPHPPATTAVPAPPRLRLSAAEIGELLVRGDTFLRMGDLTSARLFYERAANAGDGQGAMRMGATFDPSFLGRAGLGGAQGDAVKAQSWYRQALELGVAEIQRQPNNIEKGTDGGPR